MSAVLTFLTSKKTTAAAVLASFVLLFFDASFIATLHDVGLSSAITAKLVAGAKLVSVVLAALGYSPLKKPTTEAP